jgi:aspartyl/asparaginyl-tRNA synthetase
VSKSEPILPFSIESASMNEDEAHAKNLPTVAQDTRLTYRWVDTRTLANQAIFRIQSGVVSPAHNTDLAGEMTSSAVSARSCSHSHQQNNA